MTGTRRIGLVFGGRSVEHEVSVVSARGVARALCETPDVCIPLAVTSEGRWLSIEASRAILAGQAARVEPAATGDDGVSLALIPGGGGIVSLAPGAPARRVEIDVIFPLIHGWGGEDGRLQGALELAGVPYVGSDVLGSATGMDKAVARRLFETHGIRVCPWRSVTAHDYRRDPAGVEARLGAALGFPMFVKPCNGGSSVGISRVAHAETLGAALDLALSHDREAVVERGVNAREIECAVLGNDEPEASGLGEIVPSREFYDYAAKYIDGTSELLIPAPLAAAATESIRGSALAAYRALKLRGLARVDFLLDRATGEVWLNEVNTLPGFTPISMFPKLWEEAGLSYGRLVQRLVDLALGD